MLKLDKCSRLLAAVLGVMLFAPSIASASGTISQSFITSTTKISPGTILSLTSSANTVQPATNTGAPEALIGVAADQPLLQLSNSGQPSVQVAVGGTVEVLVSNINGPVSVGDKITASPLTGIGMKAVDPGEIVGTAQANLNSTTTVSQPAKNHSGKTITVKVGLIPVAINVEYYSETSGGTLSAFVPSILQNIADTISGKPVAPLRVLIGTVILFLGSITVIVALNTAIRSGIISIGRNPLAERALRNGLLDVILAALGILMITSLIAYAVLTA